MKIPGDCAPWIERVLTNSEELVERMILSASTADEALKACGAVGIWKAIKDEVELEAAKQAQDIRRRNEELHARRDAN